MIRITPSGRAAIEGAAPGHVAATRRYFFDLLSDEEINVRTKVFQRVLANLECSDGMTSRPAIAPPGSEGRSGGRRSATLRFLPL